MTCYIGAYTEPRDLMRKIQLHSWNCRACKYGIPCQKIEELKAKFKEKSKKLREVVIK